MRPAIKHKSIFSKQLIELRQTRGLTQEELAKALGVTRDAVAYYESKAQNPGAEIIQMLASYFKVSADIFLVKETSSPRKPGPKSKLERQLEQIRGLPKDKQKLVSDLIDTVLVASDR
jgi:transcriptional regulator with XRE-family HTH domain